MNGIDKDINEKIETIKKKNVGDFPKINHLDKISTKNKQRLNDYSIKYKIPVSTIIDMALDGYFNGSRIK